MKKNISAILVIFIIILIMPGCSIKQRSSSGINNNNQSSVSPTTKTSAAPTEKPASEPSKSNTNEFDPIKEQIGKMSLDEKIGQMVISGIDGTSIGSNTKKLISDYHVGGFIVLGENVTDTNQLLDLTNSLKTANSSNKIPLFLSIDQEGGRVDRMPSEFNRFPSNKAIGKINNSSFSYEIGKILADEIGSFGFNMDFAPVLDINSNPKNPIIGDRSFGASADVVKKLGVMTMKGIRSKNIIPVVKHFPGHGDTSVDSHKGLPSVSNDLKRLKSFELVPFEEAVKNNADAVMIAHILLPKIDPNNPSSMSKAIITGILRNDLKFKGIVITDDMTMGAITKNYDIGEAAVKSVNAGSDIILVCHKYQNEIYVINALKTAAENGTISESRVDESVYRILKLKQKYKLDNKLSTGVDVKKINSNISRLLKTYIK